MVSVPPHTRLGFCEKAPAMEGLMAPEPSSCLPPSPCCPFPLSSPEPSFRAAQGCRVGGREGLPALGAVCRGVPLFQSPPLAGEVGELRGIRAPQQPGI